MISRAQVGNAVSAFIILMALAAAPASAHVRLIDPNGGERLDVGAAVTIEWTIYVAHDTQAWDLSYSTSGPNGPWIEIESGLPPGDTSVGSIHTYAWTVPNAVSDRVRVRVYQDNLTYRDFEDISDANLSIGPPLIGDLNCDGAVDAFDIEPFIVALFEPMSYPDMFPDCNINRADINGDTYIDAFDIEPFLDLLFP